MFHDSKKDEKFQLCCCSLIFKALCFLSSGYFQHDDFVNLSFYDTLFFHIDSLTTSKHLVKYVYNVCFKFFFNFCFDLINYSSYELFRLPTDSDLFFYFVLNRHLKKFLFSLI
jgi:hypothetical protein